MPYANLTILYRKAQKTESDKELNQTRRAYIIRHPIDMLGTKEPMALDEYLTAHGLGFETESDVKGETKEVTTAQEAMDAVFAAFEVETE